MRSIKIGNKYFEYIDSSIQPTLRKGTVDNNEYYNTTFTFVFDTGKHPPYKKDLFMLFDKGVKFDIIDQKYTAHGCLISMITNDDKRVTISIHADFVKTADIQQRRDAIIETILNSTSEEE